METPSHRSGRNVFRGLKAEIWHGAPGAYYAIGSDRADEARLRARILKSRGICLEAVAEPKQALACYDEALDLDPKVGVKRRADAMRKVD